MHEYMQPTLPAKEHLFKRLWEEGEKRAEKNDRFAMPLSSTDVHATLVVARVSTAATTVKCRRRYSRKAGTRISACTTRAIVAVFTRKSAPSAAVATAARLNKYASSNRPPSLVSSVTNKTSVTKSMTEKPSVSTHALFASGQRRRSTSSTPKRNRTALISPSMLPKFTPSGATPLHD